MKRFHALSLTIAVMAFGLRGAGATTVIGDLNNFDTLNDTGGTCYGFEIEIADIHSTDITYTYDWNHYGAPKIREDNTDPLHPKVFVRYESTKDTGGSWGANGSFTNVAAPTITPPAGHSCTDPSVNEGCEHFGVGYYGVTTAIKYNWLVDGGAGNLVTFGTPVSVATPSWTYTPPAALQPAQAVAVIPAPVVPVPAGKQFGEPSWVKVIKTTSHNANNVELRNLISADTDGDGLADWQNQEPDQVETEWFLLQANNAGNVKNELQGGADDMGDGSETVTRRYEFYHYGAAADTLDGETGEAMCSEVNPTTDPNDPNYLHGIGDSVAVTDPNGDTYYVNCAAQVVVGTYIGAQMAGFDAAAPLGLVDNLQDGEQGQPYTPRTIVVGGDSPYAITVMPADGIPAGLVLGDYLSPDSLVSSPGVLSGTPTVSGDFTFTVEATDAANATVSKTYALHIAGPSEPTTTTTTVESTTTTSTSTTTTTTTTLEPTTTTSTSTTTTTTTLEPTTTTSTSTTTTTSQPTTTTSSSTTTTLGPSTYTVTVAVSGSGKVTSSPKGIKCGKKCSQSLAAGTSITLTAKPANKHAFVGWTGDCGGTSPACTVVMQGDRSIGAVFN